MPSIEIKRPHSRPLAEARKKVQHVADHLSEKFDLSSEWQGDTLHFQRSGVDGHIQVGAKLVHVTVNLGFLLGALRGSVEREIHRYLDQEFD